MPWHFSFEGGHVCHWWQESSGGKITAMTGLLLLLLLVAALSFGLEMHHRHLRRQGPSRVDDEVRRELRVLGI
jgi:hypothetical protein